MLPPVQTMVSSLPEELLKPLEELRSHMMRLHSQNLALLARQTESDHDESIPLPNAVYRDRNSDATSSVEMTAVERINADGEVSVDSRSLSTQAWTDAPAQTTSAQTLDVKKELSAQTTKTAVTVFDSTPLSSMYRQDLHPSVQDDPGIDTLAGNRLGILKHPSMAVQIDNIVNIHDLAEVLTHHDADVEFRKHPIQIMATSNLFKGISAIVIAANAIFLGASADSQVKRSLRRVRGEDPGDLNKTGDIIFTVWFTVELMIRIIGEGVKEFFLGDDFRWNNFDALLVVNSIVELAVPAAGNFSFLRILRVFRLVRVVRIVRTVKALQKLRTMVFALMNAFLDLMWALFMIILIAFIFGIIFASGVSSSLDSIDTSVVTEVEDAEKVAISFGSMYETMVTLILSITGGNDWMMYGENLRLIQHGEMYFLIFCFYIGFSVVGVLNVVTGIFVDSAVCTRTDDEVVQCFQEDLKRTSGEVRRIFKDADTDKSGTLSLEEFVRQLENPWVKAYFSGLDIDPSEARIIFTLLDTDGSDAVSIDEFVDGTMKLKGHAKSIDVMALMYDQARFTVKFNKLCSYIEDEIRSLKSGLLPEVKQSPRMFHSVQDTLAMMNKCSKPRLHSCIDRMQILQEHHITNRRASQQRSSLKKAPTTATADTIVPSSLSSQRVFK